MFWCSLQIKKRRDTQIHEVRMIFRTVYFFTQEFAIFTWKILDFLLIEFYKVFIFQEVLFLA